MNLIRLTTKIALLGLLISTRVLAGELSAGQESALNTVKAFISAFENLDADAALALVTEDVVLEMPFPLAPGEGKYGTKKMTGDPLRKYMRGIPVRNSHISFNKKVWRVTTDNVVIFEADGSLVRANGKPYKNKYIMVFQVHEKKVASWKEYFNPVVAARTFGIPLESLP